MIRTIKWFLPSYIETSDRSDLQFDVLVTYSQETAKKNKKFLGGLF